jgi:hypothetical protein
MLLGSVVHRCIQLPEIMPVSLYDADQAPFLYPLLFSLAHASGRSITSITLGLLWAYHETVDGEESGGGLKTARRAPSIGDTRWQGQSRKRATFSHRHIVHCPTVGLQ